MIHRLDYRTYWGNTSLSLFLSGFKRFYFSVFWFMTLQKLSMKLEPCNSTHAAVFHCRININLYLYLGSFCSSVGGITVQTKTFNCSMLSDCLDFFFISNKTNRETKPVKLATYSELQISLFSADVTLSICYHEKPICWTANKVQRTGVSQPSTFSTEKGVYCKLPSLAPISIWQWFSCKTLAKQSVCREFHFWWWNGKGYINFVLYFYWKGSNEAF